MSVDRGAQLELLDHDARFFLPGLPRLLRRLEAVLAEVHDPHDDRAGLRRDLDEIEASFLRDAPGFFEGNDADLLTVGADETDGTEADLIVHANLIVDAAPPLKLKKRKLPFPVSQIASSNIQHD